MQTHTNKFKQTNKHTNEQANEHTNKHVLKHTNKHRNKQKHTWAHINILIPSVISHGTPPRNTFEE